MLSRHARRARRLVALKRADVGVLALLCTLGVVIAGCTGAGAGDDGAGLPGHGGGGTAGIPIDSEVAKTQPIDPGFKQIHRLNSSEYNATVADVLGTQAQPANSGWREGELDGFDNMAAVLGIDADQYQRYFDAAQALAAEVFQTPALRQRVVTCESVDDGACVASVIQSTGLRVFRRPLSAEEVQTYAGVYADARQQGDDHSASLELVLRALLSSAEFLYRIELDPEPTTLAKHPLTGFELASRLSYLLWGSAPDDELLAAAQSGSLNDDAGLTAATERLLAHERSGRFVRNFAGQWLGARKVIDHPTSVEVYPTWTPQIASAAAEEMYSFFDEFLRGPRSFAEFVHADLNFVDSALAAHYGLPAPASGRARLENTADGRAGFLGLAGFLAMSSLDRRTSPTLRGRWILLNILCTHPPDPPPGIPPLDDAGDVSSTNIRERLAMHSTNPGCAACHNMFDPYGLALEQFDGIGKFRTTYPDGSAIDPATELLPSSAYPDGLVFSGLSGAADAVVASPSYMPCVAEKVMTYALGRRLTETDRPYLERATRAWQSDTPTLGRLIHSLVGSESFRYRRGGGQ